MDEKITTASLIEQLEQNQIESLAVTEDHLKELGGSQALTAKFLVNQPEFLCPIFSRPTGSSGMDRQSIGRE